MAPRESERPRHRERGHHHDRRRSSGQSPRKPRVHAASSATSSQPLSADTLARLNQLNQNAARQEATPKKARRKRHREVIDEQIVVEKSKRQHKRKKRRVVSGALLEEGDSRGVKGLRGGNKYEDYKYEEYDNSRRKKRFCRQPLNCVSDLED